MDVSTFLVKLRRRAPATESIEDPLQHAQLFIDAKGDTGEGKALLAIVKGLYTGEGEFSEAELYSFSRVTLILIPLLMDARLDGRYPEWKWHRASCYPSWRFLLDLQEKYEIA